MDKNLNVEFTQISKYEMDIITQLTKNSDGLVPKKWWPEIVIHHTWKPVGRHRDGALNMRTLFAERINRVHIKVRGFQELGYHFLINVNGIVEFGDRWRMQYDGAHVKYHNNSIGIAFIGNFDVSVPSLYQAESFFELIRTLHHYDFIDDRTKVSYHRDYAHKTCPGARFNELIKYILRNV